MTQNDEARQRHTRLPLGIALAAGLIGVVAIAAGVAAGGPGSNASGAANAVPVVSNATPVPGQGGQDGQNTQPGLGGQNGQPGTPDGQGGPWLGGDGQVGGMMGPGMRWDGIRGGMHGGVTVTSINGSQISLKTDDGWTRTIDATGATVTKDGQSATLADVKVGDEIDFQQTRNADGTYTITAIDIELPNVGGTVTAASGSTITLRQLDGTTATVNVTSNTTYQVAGRTNATLADVTVGSMAMASGTRNADGSITATTVRAFTPGQGMPGLHRGWSKNGKDGQNGQNNGWQNGQNGDGQGGPGMMGPGHGWKNGQNNGWQNGQNNGWQNGQDDGQDDGQQGQPNASAMPGA